MVWHFLAEGTSGDRANELIFDVLNRGRNLVGSLDSTLDIAVSQYLVWAESMEAALVTLYGHKTATRTVHTDRYWRIRDVSPSTQRPLRLIETELSHQLHSLEQLLEEIDKGRDLLAGSQGESLVVLDTNVYIHGQAFESVRWDRVLHSEGAKILLPLVVIDELDKVKDSGSASARKVLIALDRLLRPGKSAEAVMLTGPVSMQIVPEPRGHVRAHRNDDEIVRQGAYLQAVSQRPVTVITRDRGMRVRAEIAGLPAMMLPSNLERRPTDPGGDER